MSKGLDKVRKAKLHKVTPVDRDVFRVESPSGKSYNSRFQHGVEGAVCSCEYGQYRPYGDHYRSACSHVIAMYMHYYKLAGYSVSVWTSEADAKRQHRKVLFIGDNCWVTLRRGK